MSPDLKDTGKDGKMAVTKDEFQKEQNLVMSEQQFSPEVRCMENSGHNRNGKNTTGRAVLCFEAEDVPLDENIQDWSQILFCLCYFYQEKKNHPQVGKV